ncbi:XF1762 family protein [Amycolatopsis keratiniphila]|uniref:XF1762 family protein n=1 Tax=Amycolatopsis keratiniphila TaxID=129921 RepID=UPI0033FC684E
MVRLRIVPITFRRACEFIAAHHRHHRPPRGMKFAIGVVRGNELAGVITAGRPIARHFDDGVTLEVTRSCTVGEPNANSKLYGAAWRAARAMGYLRLITYTQEGETGASLRAAGLRPVADLRPRTGWTTPSRLRTPRGADGIRRTRWEICAGQGARVSASGDSPCATAVSAGTAGRDQQVQR